MVPAQLDPSETQTEQWAEHHLLAIVAPVHYMVLWGADFIQDNNRILVNISKEDLVVHIELRFQTVTARHHPLWLPVIQIQP